MIERNKKYAISAYEGPYIVRQCRICAFEKNRNKTYIHPSSDEGYGLVFCVVDRANNRVIDVNMGYSYEYVNMEESYFLNRKTLVEGNRYAIFQFVDSFSNLSDVEVKKIRKIIKSLYDNDQFINGNDVLSNDQYKERLRKIREEKELNQISKSKRKSIFTKK